jgi:lysozyme
MAAIDAVVDISHHNGPNLDFQKAKAAGILGVIHKATQGHSSIDPMYAANKKKALKAGLLWGAYHFATGADGVDQATAFLNALGNDVRSTLLVLDFEPNPSGSSMTLEAARAFVTHVQNVTGQ